ncbi:hypothetical protein JHK85_005038 [Glycine max]|nr:hypothetical protein JHK85_005038 [Glycine max]
MHMVTAGNIIMISTICGHSFILLAYVYGSTCLLSTPVIWCPGFSIWNAFVSWFQQLECVSEPVIWSNCPVMPTDDPLHVGTSNIIGGHVFKSTTSTSEESANQVLGSLPKRSIPENFTTNHPFGRIHEMLPVFVISYTSMHLEALHMFVISYRSMQGFRKIGVYSSFFRIFKAPNKHVVLMCSNARSSSSKRESYKPSFAGFVDVDLANNKKLSLQSLVAGGGGCGKGRRREVASMAEGKEEEEGHNDEEGGHGGGRRKKETAYEERGRGR